MKTAFPMLLKPDDRLLFTGDSITDCQRERDDPGSLGGGYPALVAERLRGEFAGLTVFNRGISGNRACDLEARLETDLIALRPTVVSILIGINDVWRRYDSNFVSVTAEFQASYRRVLERVRDDLGARVVMLEPFLLPVPADRRQWREDLDPKITAVRDLAAEFADVYVPLDGVFAAACCREKAETWLPDGVHPSAEGHGLIADAWLTAVRGARA